MTTFDVAVCRAGYDLIKVAVLVVGRQHTAVANEVVGTRYQWAPPSRVPYPLVAGECGGAVISFDDQPVLWSARPVAATAANVGGGSRLSS